MESGDNGLESEANVRPRPRLTRAGQPRSAMDSYDRGLFAGSTGASAAKSKRQGSRNRPFSTIPKMWNDSVRQAARDENRGRAIARASFLRGSILAKRTQPCHPAKATTALGRVRLEG